LFVSGRFPKYHNEAHSGTYLIAVVFAVAVTDVPAFEFTLTTSVFLLTTYCWYRSNVQFADLQVPELKRVKLGSKTVCHSLTISHVI